MNLDGQGSSVMVSHHQPKDLRPKSAGLPLKSQAVGPDEESYDDDEFESVGSPKLSSTRTPRMSWMETEHDMIDMSTQTVVHSGNRMGDIIFSLLHWKLTMNSEGRLRYEIKQDVVRPVFLVEQEIGEEQGSYQQKVFKETLNSHTAVIGYGPFCKMGAKNYNHFI